MVFSNTLYTYIQGRSHHLPQWTNRSVQLLYFGIVLLKGKPSSKVPKLQTPWPGKPKYQNTKVADPMTCMTSAGNVGLCSFGTLVPWFSMVFQVIWSAVLVFWFSLQSQVFNTCTNCTDPLTCSQQLWRYRCVQFAKCEAATSFSLPSLPYVSRWPWLHHLLNL